MFSHSKEIKIFSANSSRPLAEAICRKLGIPMGDSEVKTPCGTERSILCPLTKPSAAVMFL